jgi:hypothetical protein
VDEGCGEKESRELGMMACETKSIQRLTVVV